MGPSENCAADLQFYRDLVGGQHGTTSTPLKVVSYRPTDDVHPTGARNTQRALAGLTCTNAAPVGLENPLPADSESDLGGHTSSPDLNSCV
jgi:hypothetical protein